MTQIISNLLASYELVARTTASVVRGFFKRRTADRKNAGTRSPVETRDFSSPRIFLLTNGPT
jgi:hypothetical protein